MVSLRAARILSLFRWRRLDLDSAPDFFLGFASAEVCGSVLLGSAGLPPACRNYVAMDARFLERARSSVVYMNINILINLYYILVCQEVLKNHILI